MTEGRIKVGDATLHRRNAKPKGGVVSVEGESFYRIDDVDAMPPFLMSLVSSSDLWMFISSNGALTAGRRNPDHALFPYYTDDRIHDGRGQCGSLTILRVERGGDTYLWEPFAVRDEGLYQTRRSLLKGVFGDKIVFVEENDDLRLRFSYMWAMSDQFGVIRRAWVENLGSLDASIELLDGAQNILPSGLERQFNLEFSTLADGYKQCEQAGRSLALYRLTSIPVDKAEPSESLRANVVWSHGLAPRAILLSTRQIEGFRRGGEVVDEAETHGCRGAYLAHSSFALDAGARREWLMALDVDATATRAHELLSRLADAPALSDEAWSDVARGTDALMRIVASADGLQLSADDRLCWRHYSNTLFNVMRGGLPADGDVVEAEDFALFVRRANCEVAGRSAEFLQALPKTLDMAELQRRADATGDVDLERLSREYLPLTFSRRHGDPSRPWNLFSIDIRTESGARALNYQGNWRDIFQNWEALAASYPEFVEGMIFKFLDSSTADGYNPYRVMRDGFEWEVIDPKDAWSFIGYWGDHQIIYLLRLLELARAHHPEALQALLERRVFVYADVPYRIRPYSELIASPSSTIDFDAEAHQRAMERAARIGGDGRLLRREDKLCRATLLEKLLLPALVKLSNFIPGAGVWMNTQRPEWNDANNALVGCGVSMVTLSQLRGYLQFVDELVASATSESFAIGEELSALLRGVDKALRDNAGLLSAPLDDGDRQRVLDALGLAGEVYRRSVYANALSGEVVRLPRAELREALSLALRWIDASIRENRREDGLQHSYNLLRFTDKGVQLRRLYEMLEGQVAALGSGALSVDEGLRMLKALRSSRLWREDQRSYLLYPARRLPRFFEKNNAPAGAAEGIGLLRRMLERGDRRIVERDADGVAHFHASLRNASLLAEVLDRVANDGLAEDVARDRQAVLDLYEKVFDHQSFTGRSGSFYKYEGLGCVYWHMVSKLLLAAGELWRRAADEGASPEVLAQLRRIDDEIAEGLGVHKTPQEHGAIPIEPYSHTPGFAGAQQPGMTGQVKEDILHRRLRLGVQVVAGRIVFRPEFVDAAEFLQEPREFSHLSLDGQWRRETIGSGEMAFTLCQTLVVLHKGGKRGVEASLASGEKRRASDLGLDEELSRSVFQRRGSVARIDVWLALDKK